MRAGWGIGVGLGLAVAGAAQEPAPAAPDTNAPPAAAAPAKAANALAPADIPGVTFTGNYTSFFTGVQYGTNTEDVVYFVADLDRTTGAPGNLRHQDSRLFVYQPSVHGKTKKPVMLKIDTGEGGAIFKPYEVPVAVTNWKGSARIQFMKLNNKYGWTLLVDLSLASSQGARSRVMLFRSDVKGAQSKEDPKPIPLLTLPDQEKATITIQPDMINKRLAADVRIGEWVAATPGNNPLTVSVLGANKMVTDTMQMRADPKGFYDDKVSLWSTTLKRYKPGDYTMKSSIKLGPFGEATDEQPYSVVAPERGASRRP